MKKIITLSLTLAFIFGLGSLALAETATNVTVPVPPVVGTETYQAENIPAIIDQTTKVSYLITRGQNLITARVNYLNALKKQISASKLTDNQKSELTPLIDEQITKLTALKEQIKAGTDLTTLKTQVKSIYTDFRIYSVFAPKIRLMKSIDLQINHLTKNSDEVLAKIQARIDTAKAKGKDVTARQTALDAAKTQIPALQTKLSDLYNKAMALKPADYPDTYKTIITEIRAGIKSVATEFRTLYNGLKKAKQ